MSPRTCLLLTLLTGTICAGVALPVALAAERFPNFAGPIVLIGVLVPGLFLGLVGARVLMRDKKATFTARVRMSERTIWLAIELASSGSLLSAYATGIFRMLGALLAGVGICTTLWIFLRAVPEKSSNSSGQSDQAV